jgi:hypothetical protein
VKGKTRKDSIHERKKYEKIQYMSEKTRKDSIYARKI